MIDLSKFDPTAPWYEYLTYQKECEEHGEVDSVQTWMEERGDLKKPKRIQKKVSEFTPKKAPTIPPSQRVIKKKEATEKKIQNAIDQLFEELKTDKIDDPKTRSVEIIYDGKSYPSISAAAKANGVSPQTISRRLGRYKK